MFNRIILFWIVCGGILTICNAASASLSETLSNGEVSLDLRYRIERVEQSNLLSDATASTWRTRLGYRTEGFHAFSAFAEFEDTHAVLKDDYFALVDGNPQYSMVLDPEGSELNQAYLDYNLHNTRLRFGRQRLILDNARFVGNVGWRQNEQTYDGFSLLNTSLPNTTFTYAHLTQVQGILFNDLNMSNDILNLSYNGLPNATLVLYAYFLEFDTSPGSSHKTFGGRYQANLDKFQYTLELALQSEYKDGAERDVDYRFLEGAYNFVDNMRGLLGLELLSSNDNVAFQTPLATLHSFNGWADQFSNTPANGLKDTYLGLEGTFGGVKLLGVLHRFAADVGGADYGDELDLQASKSFSKQISGGVKLARYRADMFSVDTDKLWLWMEYHF